MMNKLQNIEYNGWTNYETWRINLEYFDGSAEFYIDDAEQWLLGREDYVFGDDLPDYIIDLLRHFVADNLRHEFATHIEEYCGDEMLQGLLFAFQSDVNYYEIATHLVDTMLEELKLYDDAD
jgi:hypothetical protein